MPTLSQTSARRACHRSAADRPEFLHERGGSLWLWRASLLRARHHAGGHQYHSRRFLNLITGFTGQFSIGHAGFMAVGAYSSAYLTVYYAQGLGTIARRNRWR